MITQPKLYTFTVKDSNKYSLEQINKFALDMCTDEAPFHGWAPGFVVEVEKSASQDQESITYTVSVYGEYLEGAGPIQDDNKPTLNPSPDRFVAAPNSL
jgi:hypothetical protein